MERSTARPLTKNPAVMIVVALGAVVLLGIWVWPEIRESNRDSRQKHIDDVTRPVRELSDELARRASQH